MVKANDNSNNNDIVTNTNTEDKAKRGRAPLSFMDVASQAKDNEVAIAFHNYIDGLCNTTSIVLTEAERVTFYTNSTVRGWFHETAEYRAAKELQTERARAIEAAKNAEADAAKMAKELTKLANMTAAIDKLPAELKAALLASLQA